MTLKLTTTFKYLFISCVLLLSSCTEKVPAKAITSHSPLLQFSNPRKCVALEAKTSLVSEPMTIVELERLSLAEMARSPTSPQVPFGSVNGDWLFLKQYIAKGDRLYKFQGEYASGVLLMRNNCVIARIVTTVS